MLRFTNSDIYEAIFPYKLTFVARLVPAVIEALVELVVFQLDSVFLKTLD